MTSYIKKIIITAFSLLVGAILISNSTLVKAAGGDLDTSFASGTGTNAAVYSVVVQPDGKIIIGGQLTTYNGTPRSHIARLNADGSLDTSFNPGAGANSHVETIALQSDGKIIIGGEFTTFNGTPRTRIARLNSDGSLDTTFDPGTGATGSVLATAVQADGKIIIGGGFVAYNGTSRRYIARINPDGSLDTSFNPGTGADAPIRTTTVQSDGKILIGGEFTTYNSTARNCIARLNADGSLDATFSPGINGNFNIVYRILLQPDGKIIVGGNIITSNSIPINITRLNADGSADSSFHPGASNSMYTAALQSDGKIVIGGVFNSYGGTARNYIARINSDGSLDTTFNPGAGANWYVHTIALQPNGKIIIGGVFTTYNNIACGQIARLLSGPGTVSFSAANYSVNESAGTATITVNRTGGSVGAVTVNYSTSDGTATAGSDYNSASGTLSFADGETSKSINIPITNDSQQEANETINLSLSNVTGDASLGAQSTAILTINDDDTLPSISINDISIVEGNSGQTTAVFTIGLSVPTANQVTVHYSTSGGTATENEDYMGGFGSILFGPNQSSKTISVPIVGDTLYEPDETFFVNLSNPTNAVIDKAQGVGTILNDDVPNMQFTRDNYTVNEGASSASIVVTRGGDLSVAATVNYATSDTAGLQGCNVFNGAASSRCDYATTVGTLRFAAGESSKTIFTPIVDDGYVDGMESFTIKLSDPTGTILGSNSTATITIFDDDFSPSNPIVGVPFFVRQQYIDFLGREPDAGGFAGWQNILNNCTAGDTSCDRIAVSSGFFRSPEFQDRGSFIFRFYAAALGRNPLYAEFMPDLAKVSGFLSDAQLEANKVAFVQEFMTRTEFASKYNSLSNTAFVDTLIQTSGLTSHPLRGAWIDVLNNGTATRAEVLRAFTESLEVYNKFYNQVFVVMQYFGYLRRDPDASYLQWIQIMNSNGGDYRGMISGFMNSNEYVLRFGP
jgi:uncharacterized delta-60 repeat protein